MAWGTDLDGDPSCGSSTRCSPACATPGPRLQLRPALAPAVCHRAGGRGPLPPERAGDARRPALVVTVMAARTSRAAGARTRTAGGAVLDVASRRGRHARAWRCRTPRAGTRAGCYVLNSGMGALEAVDSGHGRRGRSRPCPATPAGSPATATSPSSAFRVSARRRSSAASRSPRHHEELKCGVGVVDLVTGNTVATLEFETGVEEIFDVQVLPETRCVALAGGRPEEEDEIWVVPPEAGATALGPAEAVALNRGNALQDAGDQQRRSSATSAPSQIDPAFAPALQNLGYLLVPGPHRAGIASASGPRGRSPRPSTGHDRDRPARHLRRARRRCCLARADRAGSRRAGRSRAPRWTRPTTLVPTNFFCRLPGPTTTGRCTATSAASTSGPDLSADRPRRERGPTAGPGRVPLEPTSATTRSAGSTSGGSSASTPSASRSCVLSIGSYDDGTARRYRGGRRIGSCECRAGSRRPGS